MATAALRRAMNAFTRPPDPTDAALLRQFADGRSETAFAALVRRHGPLVLGVCRRMVPDRHLAEDAFQAAFVVLARRAGGIDPTRPLGPWLYGVAHRVALRARTMIGRRRKRETLAAGVPEVPHTPPVVDDTTAILDEEIARLPDATREAVILCELQGLSRREAAKRLGIAEGTLSSRLAAARKVLAAKLRSRGVALTAALAGAAVLPPALASAAVAAATGATLSSVVVSLADGASAMTLLNKLKLTGVAMLFLLLSAGGVGPWGANETAAAPVPKVKDDGLLWVYDPDAGKLVAYTPDGDEVKAVQLADKAFDPQHFLGITADGRAAMLAVRTGVVFHDEDADPRGTRVFKVHLLPLHEPGKPADTGIDFHPPTDTVFTSHDGEFLYRCRNVTKPGADRGTWAVTRFDRTGKNPKEFALPDHRWLAGVLPDGDFLLEEYIATPERQTPLFRWTPGDDKPVLISGAVNVCDSSLSPDGKTLLATSQHLKSTAPPDGEFRKLVGIDPATGKATDVVAREKTGNVRGWWSPDGKRVAVQWHEWVPYTHPRNALPGQRRWGGGEVNICHPDGTAGTVILKLDDPGDDHPGSNDPRFRKRLLGWFPRHIKAPVPKEKNHGLIWFHDRKAGELVGYMPDGREGERRKLPADQTFVGVTPDGKQILYSALAKGSVLPTYHLRPFDGDAAGTNLEVTHFPEDRFESWTPDGKKFLRGRYEDFRKIIGVRAQRVEYDVVDVVARTSTPVKTPDDTHILGWAPDGERFVGTSVGLGQGAFGDLCVFTSGGKPTPIRSNDGVSPLTLASSVDGQTQLAGGWKRGPNDTVYHAVYRFDPAADEPHTELLHEEGQCMPHAVPSPDGTRLAVAWTFARKQGDEDELRLTVAKADGTGRTTVTLRDKGKGDDLKSLALLGWFPTSKIKAPVPKEKADSGLIWTRSVKEHTLTARTPDGTVVKEVVLPEKALVLGFTPDGAKMMFAGKKGKAEHEPGDDLTLHVGDISEKCEGVDTGLGWAVNDQFVLSPDGKQVVRSRLEKVGQVPPGGKVIPPEYSHVLYDLGTKKETKIDLPVGHQILQWSADGETWRVMHYNLGDNPALPSYRQLTASVGEKPKLTPVCDGGSFLWLRPQPGGKTLLGTGSSFPTDNDAEPFTLFRVADGKADPLVKLDGVSFAVVCWSPDGKRIGCLKYELDPKVKEKLGDTVLVTFEADGTKEKKLFTAENEGHNVQLLGWFPIDPKAAPAKKDDPKAKPPVKEPIKAPVPKQVPDGMFLVCRFNRTEPDKLVEVFDPSGQPGEYLKLGELRDVRRMRLSPDGKRLAFTTHRYRKAADTPALFNFEESLYVVDLPLAGPPKEPLLKNLIDPSFVWAADGKTLFLSRVPAGTDLRIGTVKGKPVPQETVRFDPATGKEEAVKLPDFHTVQDLSPDGKTLLTRTKTFVTEASNYHTTYLVPLDTLKPKRIGDDEEGFASARFSPDGTRLLGVRGTWDKPKELGVFVADVKSGDVTAVPLPQEVHLHRIVSAAWSPGGKRVAVLWVGPNGGKNAPGGGGGKGGDFGFPDDVQRVVVLDVSGKNAETVRTFDPGQFHYEIEWANPQLTDPKKDDPKAKPPVKEPIKAPVPKAKAGEEMLLISSRGGATPFLVVSPDGKSKEVLPVPTGIEPATVRVSPDGRWAAYGEPLTKNVKHAQGYWPNRVRVIDLHSPDAEPRTLMHEVYGEALMWSADRKSLFVSRFDPKQIAAIKAQKNGLIPMATTRVDLATGKETPVELPEEHRALAVSPDGQTWLTNTIDATRTTNEAFVVTTKGGKVDQKTQVGKSQLATQFSADGKRALCGTGSAEPGQFQLASAEVATSKLTEIKTPDVANKNWIGFARWSADGTRLAFAWTEQARDRKGNTVEAARVTVCDADGSNPVTVAELEPGANIRGIDWMPTQPAPTKDDPKAKPPKGEPIVAPVPKVEKDVGLIWTHNSHTNTLAAYTPDGKEAKKVQLPKEVEFLGLTPDGKMAFADKKKGAKDADGLTVHVGDISEACEGTDTGLEVQRDELTSTEFSKLVWSPDGKQVVLAQMEVKRGQAQFIQYSHTLYDLAAKKRTPIDLPVDHKVTQWSADGTSWRVTHMNANQDPNVPYYRQLTAGVGEKPKLTPVCDAAAFLWLNPLPDGKSFLGAGHSHPVGNPATLTLFKVAGGKAEEVAKLGGASSVVARLSPDGKQIACMKYGDGSGMKTEKGPDSVLVVLDADGTNETKLFTIGEDNHNTRLLGWFPAKAADPKAKPAKGE